MVKSASQNVLEKEKRNQGFLARYNEFCRRQESQGILWYLIPLMSLSAVVMPVSIMAMSWLPGYIPFIAVSILLFFTNVVLTIAEQSKKVVITFYLFTVAFHLVVPFFIFVFELMAS